MVAEGRGSGVYSRGPRGMDPGSCVARDSFANANDVPGGPVLLLTE